MKFRRFDLARLPFSQGMAIQEIIGHIGGQLLEAGERPMDGGNRLLLRSKRGGREAQSVWLDDGVSTVRCTHINLGDGWQEKVQDAWERDPNFSPVFADTL